MMRPGARSAIAAAAVVVAVVAIYGSSFNTGKSDGDQRLVALRQVVLPEDGLPLYQALLEHIPDVVAQVPCACCDKSLTYCYPGGCPPT